MTTEATSAKLDSILRKVTHLLNQADHPNTGKQEADTFRAKAEALMLAYRIEESQLSPTDHGPAVLPQWRTIVVCKYGTEFRRWYATIAADIVSHFGCKVVQRVVASEDGSGSDMIFEVCGYASDLHFIEAMYATARMAFGARLEPKYDPTLSEQVNAYLMRSAGMEGRRIAEAIYGRDDKSLRPKVRAMFKKEAEARGEDPTPLLGRGVNVKLYRESYASGFVTEFYYRLRNMRQARGMEATGLVLASRDEAIAEMFYAKYPNLRPAPAGTKAIGNEQAECAKCAKAASGYCRDHQWMKPRKARAQRYDATGASRGADAARTVDLSGPQGKLA
jgi:hypothetical protein